MKKSIATVCLSGTITEKLRAAAAAGFDGVELFEPDLVVAPESPAEIRDLAASLGLSLDLYQPFRDFEAVTPPLLAANLRRAEAKFTLMNELGIGTMLLCSNVATATVNDDEVMVTQLRTLAELAARFSVRVAYEALAWGTFVSGYEHAWRLVQAVDHPNLGVCLDSFHILSRGHDPAGIEKIPGEKIFFIQLADALPVTMDVLSWSRHHRVFPGEGRFALDAFLAQVLRTGYAGPLSLEIFNDVFRQVESIRTAVDAMRSLTWLEDQTATYLARGNAGASHAPLAILPRVADPTGINFVEIKAEDPREIERLLYQLGFTGHGPHRSKRVRLWSQGAARVIVNLQQAESWQPTVSAIGCDVPDPEVAVARAVQLSAAPVPRGNRADEEELLAVRAPDDTEVFLCRATEGTPRWMLEFHGVAERELDTQTPEASLVTRIDHINLAQPWQHFDEAVLFYSSTLSLTPEDSLDVAGPVGLVRSQVLRTTDGAVRLALNVVPPLTEQNSTTVHAAHPQHVAFATDDVVAVARRAATRGLAFLPVPANYYADIRARFDLPDGVIATLAELNLLYDRDADGEYLHFYTPTAGNVFFEVVERRALYEGYGAPNAPVRLAAQYTANERRTPISQGAPASR
ncbi:dehydroshikimate dehydratase QsuB [Klugiella xanthotipulae]|uniref:3-dehydroshikimate dehydratase n=1 Tax=Klugiella xanthotipulae TaxID=244735 RepID=A0A543HT92_9MICO|nr:sugar phosphate isomerase/epimerase and 4-hydroxyphenylpyruvate domain-containing protein [Klugiella xanthotipulae]TQM61571.1 4-hydroxyphenylpyruvate dioxygenase [Klugiella xanthotipulae]